MKNIFLVVALSLFVGAFAQQKELTLEEAVLSRSKGLIPENIDRLQWVSGTNNYIYLEDNYYVIKTVEGKQVAKFGLEKFEETYPSLKKLPRFKSISATEIVFEYKNQVVHFDYKAAKEIGKVLFDEKAANKDYHNNKVLAYTLNNNLYVATTSNSKIAVTNIQDKNIVSGQAIHRYEFGISKGTFWSPKGNYLAFYQKDETNVTDYPLVDVTTYPATVNNIKYPMAGQKSEIAKIGIFDVKTSKTIYLNIDTKDEHYLTNLSWTPDEKFVLVAEVNREQTHMWYNRYDVITGEKVNTLFEEKSDKWVEPENDAAFLPNSNTDFLWMSERDGFMNLYLYNTSGELKKKVTQFDYVIKSILGFHVGSQSVFVSATDKDARNTHIVKISIPMAMFINITPESGVHNGQISDDGTYLIDNYSSLTVPRKIDVVTTKPGTKPKNILTAKNPLATYKLGTTEFVTLKSKDGFDLYSRVIKPANFDPSKKYPVLVYVYGGTHAQLVTNNWLGGARLWMHWLATQKEYIIFTLDNRGSAARGFAFESVIHRVGGEPAMEDQLVGVDYLKTLSYVDSKRIAVHGWSYGGFMASSLMLRHPGVYTVGAAGGPVTDWKYYEVMYGERYMDTPQENPEGYANSRVGKYLENLEGKLLIIHGSIDPTVVPQHSMTLLQEAVEKEVQIDFFTYPMHPHNVRGKDRVHLMTKILDYIVKYNK
ncbi:MAG: DPP IV N-terminal domain-containing protein [Flavobacteriales bacterium]|nr:DPP IV N-terminal domain-containing protein [Flavobacteriales bacterium]